ncbi:MAG: hypothetical protein DRN40_06890, partial [Thermoplasmata archaeon]
MTGKVVRCGGTEEGSERCDGFWRAWLNGASLLKMKRWKALCLFATGAVALMVLTIFYSPVEKWFSEAGAEAPEDGKVMKLVDMGTIELQELQYYYTSEFIRYDGERNAYILNSSISIGNGTVLTISGLRLIVNTTYQNVEIIVESGGELRMSSTNLSVEGSTAHYMVMKFYGKAEISESQIGPETQTDSFKGLKIYSSRTKIVKTVIQGSSEDGVYCQGASPILLECIIRNNGGSGVRSEDKGPIIHLTEIYGNSQDGVNIENTDYYEITTTADGEFYTDVRFESGGGSDSSVRLKKEINNPPVSASFSLFGRGYIYNHKIVDDTYQEFTKGSGSCVDVKGDTVQLKTVPTVTKRNITNTALLEGAPYPNAMLGKEGDFPFIHLTNIIAEENLAVAYDLSNVFLTPYTGPVAYQMGPQDNEPMTGLQNGEEGWEIYANWNSWKEFVIPPIFLDLDTKISFKGKFDARTEVEAIGFACGVGPYRKEIIFPLYGMMGDPEMSWGTTFGGWDTRYFNDTLQEDEWIDYEIDLGSIWRDRFQDNAFVIDRIIIINDNDGWCPPPDVSGWHFRGLVLDGLRKYSYPGSYVTKIISFDRVVTLSNIQVMNIINCTQYDVWCRASMDGENFDEWIPMGTGSAGIFDTGIQAMSGMKFQVKIEIWNNATSDYVAPVIKYITLEFLSSFHTVDLSTLDDFTGGTYDNTSWDTQQHGIRLEDPAANSQGSYTSPAYDAGMDVYWNYIKWNGNLSTQCNVTVQTRTKASTSETWSSWSTAVGTSLREMRINSPKGRYFQFRLILQSSDNLHTPFVKNVSVRYSLAKVISDGTQEEFEPYASMDNIIIENGVIMLNDTSQPGTYISRIHSTGSFDHYSEVYWLGWVPNVTRVRMSVRVANSTEQINSAEWLGPTGNNSWFTRPGQPINASCDGKNYIQFKLELYSLDGVCTPVILEYGCMMRTYYPHGVYVSRAWFFSEDIITHITPSWNRTSNNESVKLYITSNEGVNWTEVTDDLDSDVVLQEDIAGYGVKYKLEFFSTGLD